MTHSIWQKWFQMWSDYRCFTNSSGMHYHCLSLVYGKCHRSNESCNYGFSLSGISTKHNRLVVYSNKSCVSESGKRSSRRSCEWKNYMFSGSGISLKNKLLILESVCNKSSQ